MDTQETELKTIPLFSVNIPKDIDAPLLEVIHSDYIGQGKKVEEFEGLLAKYFGTKNVLTVNSGTSALHLAMKLAGLDSDSEIITTPQTCLASNAPAIALGAKIIWADIDPLTGLIDPLDVERKITSKTKLILGVDWGGTACNWDELNRIGRKYGVKTLEDAAHAFGAKYKGRMVGTLADYTIFSMQAIKHMTCGDGGLLICKDSSDYRRGKLLRWYGIDRETDKRDSRIEEDVPEIGFKFHMNDINATIGIIQMNHINKIIVRHQEIAERYLKELDRSMFVPALPANNKDYGYVYESVFWLYTILLPNELIREKFVNYMKEKNIMVSQVHRRNDTHSALAEFKNVLPGVDDFTGKMICIPVNYQMTEGEVKRVIDACKKFSAL